MFHVPCHGGGHDGVEVGTPPEPERPAHGHGKRAVAFFGWVFFFKSSGPPHVRHMGCKCGEPNETELTHIGVKLNGSRRAHASVDDGGAVAEGPGEVGPLNSGAVARKVATVAVGHVPAREKER